MNFSGPGIGFFILLIYMTLPACEQPVQAASNKSKRVKIDSDITLLHKMQGRWLDVKNDEAVIEVDGDRFLSIYQEEVMNVHRLEVFDNFPANCEGTPSKEGLGFFVTRAADGSAYCYQLLSLDYGKMHYEALGPVKQ